MIETIVDLVKRRDFKPATPLFVELALDLHSDAEFRDKIEAMCQVVAVELLRSMDEPIQYTKKNGKMTAVFSDKYYFVTHYFISLCGYGRPKKFTFSPSIVQPLTALATWSTLLSLQ